MNSKLQTCSLALLVLLGHATEVAVQNYNIEWFTVDGGGGISTNGAFALSGTIGQPDAGAMSGGNYTVVGGFWSIVAAVQTPGAPYLYVTNSSGTATIRWQKPADGFVLDQTTALAAPPLVTSWSQVPFPYQTNATSIFITVPAPAGNKFYRLRKP